MLENFKNETNSSTEELLKSILDSAFDGIMSFDSIRNDRGDIIDFEWLFINDVAEELLDLESDDVMGERLISVLPLYQKYGIVDRLIDVVLSGKSTTFEQQVVDESSNRWYQMSIVKLGDGCTMTLQDITDEKEAIKAVKSRENKYQRLFEESIDAIFFVNHDFFFVDANEALIQAYGYSSIELSRMSLDMLFEDQADFLALKAELEQNGRREEYETVLLDRNQYKRYCTMNSVSIIDLDTDQQNYIGVIRDMTKRKQADLELLRAEKLSMTGKLARTIAHEVRNPLTNLSLALEQLKDEIPEEVAEDAELYFNIISRNTDRIGKLISDLLNSSKPKELQLVNQSLNRIVSDTLDLVRDRLNLQSMTLEESYEAAIPDFPLDADQLNVAILNLFINAIEAMKPEVGVLTVTTVLEKGKAILTITDNGKGIDQKSINHLFEPFFTGKKEGTGLGLTTVQNIVHSHQGVISINSELGVGTTFYVTFNC
ncbi:MULTISPECIES: ATP-binding protein [Reichenbachiella]|uniref:ATP-binding protein n=1 Tax=Reichenbachiella TaxID=156993 RepID=UPI000E6C4CFE|nr:MULTISPECIES: ATP-binding protein [Reichenbachiella]MBU2913239.1 PAS domain S-box protein [Reichenbachiella agariperforans]RJE74770.1 hypothetical protein BGP76_16695 [Reichenbachiella sp. MSK19-1]